MGSFFMPRTADSRMPGALSFEAKRKLIANGTYNADGTVNMETAKRLGRTETGRAQALRRRNRRRLPRPRGRGDPAAFIVSFRFA